jgi:hypothetical protein
MAAQAQIATQADSRQYVVFKKFQTMNTQSARVALDPQHLAWLENLQPVSGNDLVTVPGPGPTLATVAGQLIKKQFFATYGNADYTIAFTQSGAGYQINLGNGAQLQFAPPGTFSDPDMTLWQSQRILIADPTAGYCTWDGLVFVQSGGVSPSVVVTAGGTGYTVPPTVAITGGSGSGVTATATVLGGSVVGVQITNPGINYQPGDVFTVTFGGPGVGAAATVKTFPRFTFPVTTIAVAFGRVWLAGGRILQYLGTAGFDDSNPANAAGFTTVTDADLVHSITALRSLNNYLYIFGDNSVKQIGTIQVSGSATLFAITTLSSDQGTVFPLSIASYNRLVVFSNYVGVWAIFGASVEKISDMMDGIFPQIDFTQPPQALVADINSIRCYMLLVRYADPNLGPRSMFLSFMNKKWFIISQGNSILSASNAVVGGRVKAFASSGSDLTPILADITVPVTVLARLALTDHGKEMLGKRLLRVGVTQSAIASGVATLTTDTENGSFSQSYSFAFPVIWLNNLGQVVTWINGSGQLVTFVGSGFLWQEKQAIGSGIYVGASLSGTFTGWRLNTVVLEYEDAALMRSKNKIG